MECLGDLQGPKFRVGELAGDPIELVNGEVLEFGISKEHRGCPDVCRLRVPLGLSNLVAVVFSTLKMKHACP